MADPSLTSSSSFEATRPFFPPMPRLASTVASREHAFDADPDELPDEVARQEKVDEAMSMHGLLQQGANRGSVQLSPSDRAKYMGHGLEETLEAGDFAEEEEDDDDDDGDRAEGGSRGLLNGHSRAATARSKEGELPARVLDDGASLWSAVSNMANAILGAGIIGLPYALRQAGFFLGIALVVVLGYVTDWTIRLIAVNSKLTGQPTYIGMMEASYGLPGKAAVSFFQFTFAFGGMCAFEIIVGDTIPHVLSSLLPSVADSRIFGFLFSRSFVICFFTAAVSYPLSLHRDIAKLSKASALALVSMVVIVVSVAVKSPTLSPELRGDPSQRWTFVRPGLFEAMGVISFAFVCHHNSLLIYGSLRTPTLDRFARVIHLSTALSVASCLVMSISGYLAFTTKTQANILNNFPSDDLLINIARLCFGLNMFTTLPLECFVCRETLETYFYPGQMFDQQRHIIFTTALVASAMIISLATCDLGIVLELTGGFAASALAYVFPAACALKVSPNPVWERANLASLVTVAFGLSVMVIATASSLIRGLDPDRPAKICSA